MKKAILVNRVSTSSQDYKLQEKDCLEFAKKKDLEVIKIFGEVASAGKSKQKLIFEAQALAIKEDACIIVWKYDRSFRNKKDFANFMLRMYKIHNIKVYSVQEEWVNMLWESSEKIAGIPEPYYSHVKEQMKLNWELMIKIIGKMAEDEIKDKGARVKLAVVKKTGKKTKSYKGNVWGRKSLSKKTIQEVLDLKKSGMSIREIADSVFYWDKNNNRKAVSKSAVHKLLNGGKD